MRIAATRPDVRKRTPVEDSDTVHAYIQLASSSVVPRVPPLPCYCDALDDRRAYSNSHILSAWRSLHTLTHTNSLSGTSPMSNVVK